MNGKKLLTILLCVMLIGTLLPAGVFASENGEVSAASAVSVSEDGSNALSADSAGKPADKQTAENEQAIPAKADEKMAASDNSEKMAPAESGKKDVQEGSVQSSTEPEDEKAQEAGCPIVGGHTIRDNEPKYGLAVVGMVHPDKILYKGKLSIGDKIILTKPIGFGVTVTASKVGLADPEDLNTVIKWMKTLNKKASDLAVDMGCQTGTDITGFSLLGHSWEIIRNSDPGIGLKYEYDAIPFTPNYEKYIEMGMFSAGANENYNFYLDHVKFAEHIDENHQMILFDPQTSGGLLLGVKPDRIDEFMKKATEDGQFARVIGEAVEGNGIEVI